MKKPIRIDIDIWDHAAKYICDQYAILEKYGELAAGEDTYAKWADTVHRVATTAQTIRNIERRINAKKR